MTDQKTLAHFCVSVYGHLNYQTMYKTCQCFIKTMHENNHMTLSCPFCSKCVKNSNKMLISQKVLIIESPCMSYFVPLLWCHLVALLSKHLYVVHSCAHQGKHMIFRLHNTLQICLVIVPSRGGFLT